MTPTNDREHKVNPTTDRCVMCGLNRFNRKRNPKCTPPVTPPTTDREPRGEQTPGELTIDEAVGYCNSIIRDLEAFDRPNGAAALRTLIREHERQAKEIAYLLDNTLAGVLCTENRQLQAKVAALEAELAAERAAKEAALARADKWEKLHDNRTREAADAILEREEAQAEARRIAAYSEEQFERFRKLLAAARAELASVPDRGHGPLLSEDDHLAVEAALREKVADLKAENARLMEMFQNTEAASIGRAHGRGEPNRYSSVSEMLFDKKLTEANTAREQAERDRDAATKAKDLLRHDLEFTIYSQQVEHAKALAAVEAERDEAKAAAARFRNVLYQIGCGKETWTREQMIDLAVEQLATNAGKPLDGA